MSENYAMQLTKVSVSRACMALGYTHTTDACLESLTDVVKQYIQKISVQMQERVEGSGRVAPGIHDLISGILEWMKLAEFAFEDVRQPHKRGKCWNVPFPFALAHFPVYENAITSNQSLSSAGLGEQIRGSHIPSHLPLYPPIHTYKPTVSIKNRKRSVEEVDPLEENKKKLLDVRRIQTSLIKLEQHHPGNESLNSSSALATRQGK